MKKTTVVTSVLLALLMLFSVIGFAAGDNPLDVTSVQVGDSDLNGATVDGTDVIVITFSRGMTDNQDENAALIGVYTNGQKADYTVHPVEDKNIVKVQLNGLSGGEYELRIGAGVKANNGKTLGEDLTVPFAVKDTTVVVPTCQHICHSDKPVAKFIWNFMNKIFKFLKINQYCACGEAHW